MRHDVHELPDLESAADFAAAYTAGAAGRAVRERGRFFLAVSGGTTPKSYFERLAALKGERGVDWSAAHVFFADERFVSQDDERSNYRLAKEALLSRAQVPPDRIHPVPTWLSTPEEAAAAYEEELRRTMGDAGPPRFDLIHLGMGADGHVASLFPGHPALRETTRLAAPVGMAGLSPKVPRVTLTLPVLNAAREVLFLVAGGYKSALVERIATGRESAELPAAMVEPVESVIWVVAR